MAKLTARGTHKVIGYVFDSTLSENGKPGDKFEVTYALRSDGSVLYKRDAIMNGYRRAGAYSIAGEFKGNDKIAAFESWLNDKIIPRYGKAVRQH